MRRLFQELLEALERGEGAVLATIIASSGSTPRGAGSRMLVKEDGTRQVLPKSVLTTDGLTVRLDRSARIELVDNTQTHSDVKTSDWFAPQVGFVTSRDLFSGVDSSRFAPNLSMTRAMVVTVLHKLEGNPAAGQSHTFQDVPSNAWYAQAASWAVEQGITGGVDGNSLAPDAPIAREDLGLMLYRSAQQMGIASGSGSLSGFGDGDKVSPLGGGGHGVGLRQRHFVRRQPGQPESPGQHHPG